MGGGSFHDDFAECREDEPDVVPEGCPVHVLQVDCELVGHYLLDVAAVRIVGLGQDLVLVTIAD